MRMTKITHKKETLEELAEKFITVKIAQGSSDLTMRDYDRHLHNFVRASSNSLDYEVLEQDILTYFASIPHTSPARYNKPFQYINAFLNWLLDNDYIDKNPIRANKLKKLKDEGNIKPISLDDLKVFLKSLDKTTYVGLRDYTICNLILDTGLRTSELLRLTNADYDSKEKSIVILKTVAKTKVQRIVYLSNSTAKLIDDFISIKPKEWDNFLFPNYEGKQLTTTQLDKNFAKHSITSGIKITPYQLRHTFATVFCDLGGDLFSLQKIMGHSDLRMTKRYTEIDDNHIRQQHKAYSPICQLSSKRLVNL